MATASRAPARGLKRCLLYTSCVLFTLASIVMLFFGMFVCYLIPWNGGLIYELLIMVRDNVVFFMGLFLVAGYMISFLIYWGKTLGYLCLLYTYLQPRRL